MRKLLIHIRNFFSLAKKERFCFQMRLCVLIGVGHFILFGFPAAVYAESAFGVVPWKTGQFVVYRIVSMEGEDAENRYRISITGEEVLQGENLFWVQLDMWESRILNGFNKVSRIMIKNCSVRMLIPELTEEKLRVDPAGIIFNGLFPEKARKLEVQYGGGLWYTVDPSEFFSFQDVVSQTLYRLTPHAQGRIDAARLKINAMPALVRVPVGDFSGYRFAVETGADKPFTDEGFVLWRSAQVPILGMIKMDFSNTKYWEKLHRQEAKQSVRSFVDWIKQLYLHRIPGRDREDTCSIELLDYGIVR